MTTKRQNLKLSELISEMRNIIHNNGRYCFFDFTVDIEMLASMQEKTNYFILYWGVRENGTIINEYIEEVKRWSQSCKNQEIFKIIFVDSFYEIQEI